MAAYDLTIVEAAGKKFFSGTKEGNTLLFDELWAFDQYYGGTVEISRGNKTIEQGRIEELGGHYNGSTGFSFLNGVFRDSAQPGIDMLCARAEKLAAGDTVKITLLDEQEHVLDTIIRRFVNMSRFKENKRPDAIVYADGKITLNYDGPK